MSDHYEKFINKIAKQKEKLDGMNKQNEML